LFEFREVRLQEMWQATHPGRPAPEEIKRLKGWECLFDSRQVGHCTVDSVTGEIIGLAVAPQHQGLGIGRRLLSQAVDDLRASGVSRIWAETPSDPNLRAYGFYRALGWVRTGGTSSDTTEILELTD
jgi:ribosomal protein S18 acetylase RimI-like enzyme